MSTARVLLPVKLVLNFSEKDKLQTVNLCDFSNNDITPVTFKKTFFFASNQNSIIKNNPF